MIAPKPDHKLTSSCPRPLHSGYRASSVLIWAGSGLLLFDFRAADAYLRHVVLGMHLRPAHTESTALRLSESAARRRTAL